MKGKLWKEEILNIQVERLIKVFKFIWTIYMSWYTFLITLNLLALTLLAEHAPEFISISKVSIAFILINVIGIFTSFYIFNFSIKSIENIESTREKLWIEYYSANEIKINKHPLFKKDLVVYVTLANTMAILVFLILWASNLV